MPGRYAQPELLEPRRGRSGAYLFLAPAMAFLVVFFLYPVLWTVFVSVSDYDPVTATARVEGLSYYREVIMSAALWRSILNTAYFGAVYIPLTLLGAAVLAMLLVGQVRSRPVLKAIFCAPCVVPTVGAALIWRAAYLPFNGSLDRLLCIVGWEHGPGWAGWLGEAYLAMPCIALMCVWRDTGLLALILLSALGRIPRCSYEIARVDGATKWQTFAYVTLPMCLGTVALCLIMLVIRLQNVFQEIYVMTEDGGPANWTVNIPFLVYRYAYIDYGWGRAAALASVLFAVTGIIIVVQNRMLNKRLGWS